MRYNTVSTFADKEQDHFISFRLPIHAVSSPEGAAILFGHAASTSTENETSSKTEDKETFTIYTCTNVKGWVYIKDRAVGRTVDPVQYTRDNDNEMFSVDITEIEVQKLKDPSDDIHFHKVLEW